MAKSFFDALLSNEGWGALGPITQEVAFEDDAGNKYGYQGNLIAKGVAPDQPRTFGETALGMATAPAKITTSLLGSLSPYGEDGWRVPPILTEAADAISAPGKAYYEGMTPEDLQRTAMSAAGFAMGGGGLASGRVPMIAANASKEASALPLAGALDMSPEARLARARDMGFDTDNIRYHGSRKEFESFQPSENGYLGPGVYMTPNKSLAEEFGAAREYFTRGKLASEDDLSNAMHASRQSGSSDVMTDALRSLERDGFAGVDVGSELTVFDPKNIRSVNAAFDPSKSDSSNLLAANSSKEASMLPLANSLAQGEGKTGITAYHGSPHDFDKFDISKIGTGEGAQAYGHGLYFAENEGVAKSYKGDSGARYLFADGTRYQIDSTGKPYALQNTMEKALTSIRGNMHAKRYGDDVIAIAKDKALQNGESEVAALLEKWAASGAKFDDGHMYQVRINADPEDFLDWDKPLSQQSEKVRRALPFLQEKAVEARRSAKGNITPDDEAYLRSGDVPVEDLVRMFGNNQTAFRDAGIPGTKYLDANSRSNSYKVEYGNENAIFGDEPSAKAFFNKMQSAGKDPRMVENNGTRNYVVFNPDIIEILKKYGLLVPGAGFGADAFSQAEQY